MLNQVAEYVWQAMPDERGSRLLTLQALAHFADDKGDACPGLERLAKYLRMTVRNVQLLLKALQKDGRILIGLQQGVKTSTGNTNRYTILGFTDWRQGVKFSDIEGVKTSVENGQGVKSSDARGEISDIEGVKSEAALEHKYLEQKDSEQRTISEPKGSESASEIPVDAAIDTIDTTRSEPEAQPPAIVETPAAPDSPNPQLPPPPSPSEDKPKRSPAQQARDELMRAAAWAWDLDLALSASMAGKWVNFCTGQIERGKGKKEPEFYTHQITDLPMTAREIIGYRVWYDQNPTTAGCAFPTVPETINRYIETYRASRLSADLETKIQRKYEMVVLGYKWEFVSLDPIVNGQFDDSPLSPEQQAAVDAMPDDMMEFIKQAAQGHEIIWDKRPILP